MYIAHHAALACTLQVLSKVAENVVALTDDERKLVIGVFTAVLGMPFAMHMLQKVFGIEI